MIINHNGDRFGRTKDTIATGRKYVCCAWYTLLLLFCAFACGTERANEIGGAADTCEHGVRVRRDARAYTFHNTRIVCIIVSSVFKSDDYVPYGRSCRPGDVRKQKQKRKKKKKSKNLEFNIIPPVPESSRTVVGPTVYA
jgi:hypothetical protein